VLKTEEDNILDKQRAEAKDEFYLYMPIIQEIKVVFLNFGALVNDIL